MVPPRLDRIEPDQHAVDAQKLGTDIVDDCVRKGCADHVGTGGAKGSGNIGKARLLQLGGMQLRGIGWEENGQSAAIGRHACLSPNVAPRSQETNGRSD